MPIMRLPAESDSLGMSGNLSLHIDAVMRFPKDEAGRVAYINAGHMKELASFQDVLAVGADRMPDDDRKMFEEAYRERYSAGFLPSGGFAQWSRHANNPEINQAYMPECHLGFFPFFHEGGLVASEIVFYVLNSAETGNLKQATINRAVKHLQRALAELARDISSLPKHRDGLIKLWSAFKPAAHLWAAERLLVIKYQHPLFGNHPYELLAVAEELRRRGEVHVSRHTNRPLLDSAETWRVPPDFSLPEVDINLEKMLRSVE